MDPRFHDLSHSVDGFNHERHIPLLDPSQSLNNNDNMFKSDEPAGAVDSFTVPLFSVGPHAVNNMSVTGGELVFPAEPDKGSFDTSISIGTNLNAGGKTRPSLHVSVSSDPILKYISQMLMEENMAEEVWINPNDPVLQRTEKSLYEALGEQDPILPDKFQNFDTSQYIQRPNGSQFGWSPNGSQSISRVDPNWLQYPRQHNHTVTSAIHPIDQVPQLNLHCNSMHNSSSMSNSNGEHIGFKEPSIQVKATFDDNYSVMQFMKGLEEASKFLPPSSQLVINSENVTSGSGHKSGVSVMDIHDNDNGGCAEDILNGSRGRKNRGREDAGLVEARATKQIASHMEAEEAELSDMLDKVLLCTEKAEPLSPTSSCPSTDANRDLQICTSLHGFDDGREQGRRKDNDSSADLRALLVLCAQALSSGDLRTANELLKQIRGNSSPSGNGSQRLAHYFANGLEARMAGKHCTADNIFASVASKRILVADMLRAYQLYLSYCPFLRLSILYMNYMTWKMSQKAAVLHIIVFGVGFGFHLPSLIQMLSEQAGGPPKLRITGIEFPYHGLRPERMIEGTGRRLARYCKRFNVPFEFIVLPSRDWDAIKIEDLKIQSGEVIAVNCASRSHNFLDESFEEDCPRDAWLNLIRRVKPDIFAHMVNHGTYNIPFFVTRFREALFYMSSVYDMFDATISDEHKNSKERELLESELYGWGIANVIACEGPERVERPETYKQWQARHERAGFKQLPLDRAKVKEIRHKLRAWYHEDFALDEDRDWILFGWKGRILNATACWVPV